MEALLMWWNLTWNEYRVPVYTATWVDKAACYEFISDLVRAYNGRELLGRYVDETHTCRIVVFPES